LDRDIEKSGSATLRCTMKRASYRVRHTFIGIMTLLDFNIGSVTDNSARSSWS